MVGFSHLQSCFPATFHSFPWTWSQLVNFKVLVIYWSLINTGRYHRTTPSFPGQAQIVHWANSLGDFDCLTCKSQTFASHLHTGISRVLRLLLLLPSLCRCVAFFLWCTKLSHRFFCTDANLAAENFFFFFVWSLIKWRCLQTYMSWQGANILINFSSNAFSFQNWDHLKVRASHVSVDGCILWKFISSWCSIQVSSRKQIVFLFFFEAVWYQYMYIPSIYSIYYIIVPNWILWNFYLHQFWSY